MTNKKTEQAETPEKVNQDTPGSQLRAGREKLGLTQQQVADRLHLRLNNIQDIESDTHQQTVSITFTKGYVRIYAKLVGLQADPLLEAFDRLHSDEKTPAKLQSFSQRVAKEAHDERWMMVTYLVGFLVVASVVIWWFQQSDKPIGTRIDEFSNGVVQQVKNLSTDEANTSEQQSNDARDTDSDDTEQPDINFTEEAATAFNEAQESIEDNLNDASQLVVDKADDVVSNANEFAEDIEQATESTLDSTVNAVQQYTNKEIDAAANGNDIADAAQQTSDIVEDNTPAPIQDAVASVDDAISTISAQGYELNADGTVDVVFTFKDDCWVSVKDANKDTMAYGVKKKGRVMTVNGIPPVRVILGAPQNVEIAFGGLQVDMNAYEAGRSANFQLPVTGE